MPSWRPTCSEAGRELFRQLMQDHLELRAQREQRLHGGDRRRAGGPRCRRGRAYPRADHGVRRGDGDPAGLPSPRPRQPVSRRRGAEPAGGEALPRAAATGRPRSGAGLLRGHRRGDRAGHRGPAGQTPGRSTRRAGRGRLRRLLRPAPTATGRRSGSAGPVRRRQGHRHAPRGAAPGHRQGRSLGHHEAVHAAVQGRETQPQTPGRGRRRLRRRPGRAHPRRHPRPRRGPGRHRPRNRPRPRSRRTSG